MLGSAIYVIAIMGCGEASAPCEQVALVESRYESFAACTAAADGALASHAPEDFYPIVVAQCRPADGAASAQLSPADIDLPEPPKQPLLRRASSSKVPQRS